MKSTKAVISVVVLFLGVLLLATIMLPHEPILNWVIARKLHHEQSPQKRIVLINTTLTYSHEYWNREYLREALRADTQLERQFLAGLLQRRFETNAAQQLQALLTTDLPNVARSNLAAVISELERIKR